MNDNPEALDEPEDEDGGGREDERPETVARVDSSVTSSLDAFASIQRSLAGVDFSAIRAAQRAVEQSGALRKFLEAQSAVVENFARSIDFTGIATALKGIADTGAAAQAMAAQRQWAEALAQSIDFSALNSAVASSAALDSLARTNAAFVESLRKESELFSRLAERITFDLPAIDMSGLLAALDRWIPVNLRSVAALDVVATVALEEGLPLSWVPRTEIVTLLIEAESAEDRAAILAHRRDDVLDDCEEAVTSIEHEWAAQCRVAIGAMRAGFDGPAQSHASNIIDSIVLGFHGRNGREHAKKRAQEELEDLPLQLAAENLTLRPLFRALTTWFPDSGIDPPGHFSRHATSHAVGHVGVFDPMSALVAVMLATSLTVQYAADDPAQGGIGTTD
ncbi:MAG: hypothetical protein AB7L13_24420 [Acidimicrobiia bacterium]